VKKIVYDPTSLAPPAGHFDAGVRLGDWLFISGISALTNASGPMMERHLVEGIEEQAHETIANIERVLVAAGGSLDQIYEIRLILKDSRNRAAVDRVMRQRLPNKGYISHGYQGELLHPDMELEIEANAYLGPLEAVNRTGRFA
jgi:enamine deaminase RidA (YjgF/YER057c/UK114 family)